MQTRVWLLYVTQHHMGFWRKNFVVEIFGVWIFGLLHLQRPPHLCHLFSTVVFCSSQNVSCAPASGVELGTFWSSGRTCRPPKLLGNQWTPSAPRTPPSSSRTSCFPRGERCYGGQRLHKEEEGQWLRSGPGQGAEPGQSAVTITTARLERQLSVSC